MVGLLGTVLSGTALRSGALGRIALAAAVLSVSHTAVAMMRAGHGVDAPGGAHGAAAAAPVHAGMEAARRQLGEAYNALSEAIKTGNDAQILEKGREFFISRAGDRALLQSNRPFQYAAVDGGLGAFSDLEVGRADPAVEQQFAFVFHVSMLYWAQREYLQTLSADPANRHLWDFDRLFAQTLSADAQGLRQAFAASREAIQEVLLNASPGARITVDALLAALAEKFRPAS